MTNTYATVADVLARYERDVIDRICWDDENDMPAEGKLLRALEDASAEIDSFLSVRYAIPVQPVPSVLRQMTVDLGLYGCALTADKMFEQLAERAKNWRAHLKMIAKGESGLGIREDASQSDPSPAIGSGTSSANSARGYRV